MYTPFDVVRQAAGALDAGVEALRGVPRIEGAVADGLERIELRIAALDGTTASLKPQLAANREAIESQGPRLERMIDELEGAHRDIEHLRAELRELREIVEPLRGTTRRVARLNERLPGRG